MIYPIDAKATLPHLEDYEPPRIKPVSQIVSCLLQLPFVLLVVIGVIVVGVLFLLALLVFIILSWFLGNGEDEKDAEGEDLDEEADDLYEWAEGHVESDYDERCGWLKISFDHVSFKAFVDAIARIYLEDKGPGMIDASGFKKSRGSGYHAHSSDFFPQLPYEVIIGTTEGQFYLNTGFYVFASQEVWQRAIAEWRRVLLRKEPALIVLDKYQSAWCAPECRGRLTMEYLPDWLSSASGNDHINAGDH